MVGFTRYFGYSCSRLLKELRTPANDDGMLKMLLMIPLEMLIVIQGQQ